MPRRDGFSIRGFDVCRRHSRAFRHGKSCPGCDRDPEPKPIAYTPRIVVSMPWESARWLSKNRSHAPVGKRIVMTEECRRAMSVLENLIAIEKPLFREDRVTVNIMVHHPTDDSDGANFVDRVCDAVQNAIGVNDRLFRGSWDSIVEEVNPRLEVEILQNG